MKSVYVNLEKEAMSRELPYWLAIGPICWRYTDINGVCMDFGVTIYPSSPMPNWGRL